MTLEEKIAILEKRIDQLEKKLVKPKSESGKEVRAYVKEFWLHQYEKTFGHPYPIWGAKENTAIKSLVDSAGQTKAVWLMGWYLKWTDSWIVAQGHPLHLLSTSIVKLEAQLMRKGRYFDDVAEARVKERLRTKQLEEGMELYEQSEQTPNQLIGFADSKMLPGPPLK